jgi:hypothetical protein
MARIKDAPHVVLCELAVEFFNALDTLAALLDEGHSDQLTALIKTMARFHKCIPGWWISLKSSVL